MLRKVNNDVKYGGIQYNQIDDYLDTSDCVIMRRQRQVPSLSWQQLDLVMARKGDERSRREQKNIVLL